MSILVLREEKKHGQLFGQNLQCLSIQNLTALNAVTDTVCGGKTYTVTQIQTRDLGKFYFLIFF